MRWQEAADKRNLITPRAGRFETNGMCLGLVYHAIATKFTPLNTALKICTYPVALIK